MLAYLSTKLEFEIFIFLYSLLNLNFRKEKQMSWFHKPFKILAIFLKFKFLNCDLKIHIKFL